ncbi:Mov34/MPN/PAD-1 family protein [Aeromonas sobria]|uniref:Mov34/MPN/PAD-1 family protein n=1 Tax=Aeromonas sobria TaxID=646 RepID=UPI003F2C6E9C
MYEETRRLLIACQHNPAFEVVELRSLKIGCGAQQSPIVIDGVVVECCDGTVPSHNSVGVKNRERLLLLHGPGLSTPHEVRALRVDFPSTQHQNHVYSGEPASLCLYFEPWSAVERTWTPAKHLQRILWWLRETALGTLHRNDQPLERMYFVSPYQIVLPPDFNDRVVNQPDVLQLARACSRANGTVLRGTFVPEAETKADTSSPGLNALIVKLPQAVSASIARDPTTLGQLHDQLVARGSELVISLADAVKKVAPSIGLPIHTPNTQHTLVLLQLPVAREKGAKPERIDVIGFVVLNTNLASLGIACEAAIVGHDGKAYANIPILGTEVAAPATMAWRELPIEPTDVRIIFTPKDARKASGVSDEGAEIQAVLAGVGALGGCMADLWCRAGWGRWTLIDDDILHAHNLVRHIAKDPHIGWAKVDAVAEMARLTWPTSQKPTAIFAKVTDFDNEAVKAAVAGATLLVDATTTLEVPRDLSDRDESPRMVSTFFTPSGRDCVLLMEDAARRVRLSSIEAQYYRAILNSDWGESHLNGHYGAYWVGGGCRDLSGVLSQEVVQLHGSTLARQVRLLSARPEAQIRVWSMNNETGALACEVVPVAATKETILGEWRIVWDEELAQKLESIRATSLPNETGGVILGYVDQKRKAIHVVDVLEAPTDSVASRTEFTRGATGVREAIELSAELSANIVGYLGEWHSHPRHSSAMPSATDANLLAYLAETLVIDGMPALMIIVGEADISISLGQGDPT